VNRSGKPRRADHRPARIQAAGSPPPAPQAKDPANGDWPEPDDDRTTVCIEVRDGRFHTFPLHHNDNHERHSDGSRRPDSSLNVAIHLYNLQQTHQPSPPGAGATGEGRNTASHDGRGWRARQHVDGIRPRRQSAAACRRAITATTAAG